MRPTRCLCRNFRVNASVMARHRGLDFNPFSIISRFDIPSNSRSVDHIVVPGERQNTDQPPRPHSPTTIRYDALRHNSDHLSPINPLISAYITTILLWHSISLMPAVILWQVTKVVGGRLLIGQSRVAAMPPPFLDGGSLPAHHSIQHRRRVSLHKQEMVRCFPDLRLLEQGAG